MKPSCLPEKWSRKQNLPNKLLDDKGVQKTDLCFVRMLRISEVVRGASVDLNQRLTGWVLTGAHRGLVMGRGFRAVVGMVLPHSYGDLSFSLGILLQGESPGMERLDFPDERASLWVYVHFAGRHHHAAEHRH